MKSTHADGSAAVTDHRPRILPELGPIVLHGLVPRLSAVSALGVGGALEDESILRDSVVFLVHTGLPSAGTASSVREGRVVGTGRGRDRSRARAEHRPDSFPILAGARLVTALAAEQIVRGRRALVDQRGHGDQIGGGVVRAGDIGARAARVSRRVDGRGGRRGGCNWCNGALEG